MIVTDSLQALRLTNRVGCKRQSAVVVEWLNVGWRHILTFTVLRANGHHSQQMAGDVPEVVVRCSSPCSGGEAETNCLPFVFTLVYSIWCLHENETHAQSYLCS